MPTAWAFKWKTAHEKVCPSIPAARDSVITGIITQYDRQSVRMTRDLLLAAAIVSNCRRSPRTQDHPLGRPVSFRHRRECLATGAHRLIHCLSLPTARDPWPERAASPIPCSYRWPDW
jgi:hypothetical protein